MDLSHSAGPQSLAEGLGLLIDSLFSCDSTYATPLGRMITGSSAGPTRVAPS
jgi:hypothetical protein